MPVNTAIEHARNNRERILEDLITFCAIPSISNNINYYNDVQRAAEWLRDRLSATGLDNIQIIPTEGLPIVYAESIKAKSDAKTVLIYGHYDVQPAEAETLLAWHTNPFEPVIKENNLFARGATDMKGQIMAALAAVEAIMQTGDLPVNIKFFLEGEEEIGSPHLETFINANQDLLSCDLCLNVDTGMIAADLPTICYGLRGLTYFELKIFGPKHDLHSGSFGGAIHNPAQALCEIIAGMHDAQGKVTLHGFYDRVHPLSQEEREELAQLPTDSQFYKNQTGVAELWGEAGYTADERASARPTLELNGLYSGFTGEGAKTVLPAYAMAKISCRLVPDQIPDEVHQQLLKYMEIHAPATVRWELTRIGKGAPGIVVERDSWGIRAMSQALEQVWVKPPLFNRIGGSVPVVQYIKDIIGVDVINTGFSLPEDGMHGPNEKLHLPTFYKGIEALIHFFFLLNI
ncbi:MAG: dipeptidase [Chloroflexota bacterium]